MSDNTFDFSRIETAPKGFEVLDVKTLRHWTDKTFSFSTSRPDGFRFRSGEFVMIGLLVEGKPLVRVNSARLFIWE